MSNIPHDTFAHIDAGGFGVLAPECPACRSRISTYADQRAIGALRSQGLSVEEAIDLLDRLRQRGTDDDY